VSVGSTDVLGRNRADRPKLKDGKPFEISKWEVWEANQKVRGQPGCGWRGWVSIEEFDKDLQNNLYRIWNRMSSGATFRRR
jgi:RNA-directed DNA polymerase